MRSIKIVHVVSRKKSVSEKPRYTDKKIISYISRYTLEVFHACRSSLLVLYKSIFSFEFIIFLYFLIFVLFCDLNSIPANCPFQTLSSSIIILQVLFFWSLLHKIRGRKTDLLKDCLKIFNVLILFLWAALP